ncbi:MAG: putative metal-binding motif-containing protein, partial [Myxococcota bacterium]|nr:putative metal-binding motif-containing protein [Myxococcota bacterium]
MPARPFLASLVFCQLTGCAWITDDEALQREACGEDKIGEFGPTTWYLDDDGDGFGREDVSQEACIQPSGHIDIAGDCNDDDWTVNPDGVEACDSIDNDCDGEVDEDEAID